MFDELSAGEGDEGLPEVVEQRDEIGLICLISVKEQSSAKRKAVFQKIQREAGIRPRQLLGDMPVRWSSTYVMLDRAETLKEFVEPFLHYIAGDEKDRKRRQKLSDLIPTKKEWIRVSLFLKLLTRAENAQQAFSTDQGPTLHLAIPALEALHAAWSKCRNQSKYSDFFPALDAAIEKVSEYYNKTSESEVYTFSMLLDPSKKATHLQKYWGQELTKKALTQAEGTYKARYIEMYGDGRTAAPTSQKSAHSSKLNHLLRELSDSDDDDIEIKIGTPSAAEQGKPWLRDFHGYLNSTDILGNMSIVGWWGLNASRYPVWASLARDYLAVMAVGTPFRVASCE
ncbi:hypothetical protein C0991_002699 [Blastosporella zonata]|nr:hypothetical protein C0991_002699 [Blastosporella zonata]